MHHSKVVIYTKNLKYIYINLTYIGTMKMKMNLYKVLKISFIIGLLVRHPSPPCNVNNLAIIGSLPEADVPAQRDPVPV